MLNTEDMTKLVELEPKFDKRKSFYGKAYVRYYDNGDSVLLSYGTPVADVKNNKPSVRMIHSQTTLRHIKEYLKQNGFEAKNKQQILDDYFKAEN